MVKPDFFGVIRRACLASAGVVAFIWSGTALAFTFDIWGMEGSLDNRITIGAAWRMEERNPDLIGKSNLQPGLCTSRRSDGTLGNKEGHTGSPQPGNIGETCNSTSDGSFNQAYVDAPGSFSPNGDNGNLNYDRHDMVAGVAMWGGDLNLNVGPVNVFVRGIYFFDEINNDFDEFHPDTTLQPRTTRRSGVINENAGTDFDILDSYVSFSFEMFDRFISMRIGDQVINWGESAFLIPGSLNNINPPDVARLRRPGFDISELFIPVGMVQLSTDIVQGLSMELYYQYDWEPVVPDPAGTFWSTSDIAGGGTHAMLSFGKAPEDPEANYSSADNPDDPTSTISSSSRTIFLRDDITPDDGGQYGLGLKYFAESLNGGTEFGFYYSRYHSRLPLASMFAANATCISNGATDPVTAFVVDCGIGGPYGSLGAGTATALLTGAGLPIPPEIAGLAAGARVGLAGEPLPVDTVEIALEYPEDLDLYGFSFNTLLGDWAWAGEIAYRPENPLQIHTTDLIFAALQPAFPNNAIPIPGVGTLPDRRLAVPDYITAYRGREPGSIQPGEYIRGYELMKTYDFETNFLRTIGGDNFLGASQIIVLMELGAKYVQDMPDVTEVQFNADGAGTHFSNGADGTQSPRDSGSLARSADCDPNTCRQNPTQQDGSVFATDWSYGYRFVSLIRYDDAFWGINLEPLIGIFHDLDGIAPGPGGNFIEDRVVTLLGLRFDYLSKWNAEIRYTDYSGAGNNNAQNDRDYVQMSLSYTF